MGSSARHRVLVLGAGNFGTCLGQHLALLGNKVVLWDKTKDVIDGINTNRKNPKYLSTITLSTQVSGINDIDGDILAKATAILIAVPTQAIRSALSQWHQCGKGITKKHLLICAAKGIEVASHQLPIKIIEDVCGKAIAQGAVMLSGPSFAEEVAAQQPTCVTAASYNSKRSKAVQELFHAAHFRTYTSQDPIGMEVAGALKNVIAIASGACSGLGFQMNSRAALLTRGLAEMTRVGEAMGADPRTFTGLAGIGDLFLTCTSEKSRNFTVGYRLGRGEDLRHVLATMASVAEGYFTAKPAYDLARSLKVDAPIIHAVYEVLYENKKIAQAVRDLLNRDAGPELDAGKRRRPTKMS